MHAPPMPKSTLAFNGVELQQATPVRFKNGFTAGMHR
jgi:hypothetical protein